MKKVHEEADRIEKSAIAEQSSKIATSDNTTPSPERQRADYQYPFSSLTQQAPYVSPRREIIQAAEIAQDTPSSNENTPITARSEISPSHPTTPVPPLPDDRDERTSEYPPSDTMTRSRSCSPLSMRSETETHSELPRE
ncbi:hypothetical protein N7505_009050 [Penicillium chrysogenum]|uniref:Uncharacterized protein n=1 Tax=Penicillium chrysogenum TaxID=5076 RepID=A0ABQ8WA15_PENCH|nr:hypothetical protein N7505_009050 [Penicillium chrysogenum]